MCKLFAATFGISALLALMVGVVFAWTASTPFSAQLQGQAGTLSVSLTNANATSNQIYPGGGPTAAHTGQVFNGSGVPVYITGGQLFLDTNQGLNCDINELSGTITVSDNNYIPANDDGGGWQSLLQASSAWDNSCQGLVVNYHVVIDVST